ncbi:SDR family oxidoreductase [Risungbinella massiliensis]|uniref:SDR family oxidoreductase n=1 Tax=Risungbinella massiliensis TaxID=1329796 RepID=UPI0005CC302C|nr:SDR family oxidoreductase [Risungbinella massiliensis]
MAPKTALITGSSSGLGKKIQEVLTSDGWRLVLNSRSHRSTQENNHLYVSYDVTDQRQVCELREEVEKEICSLDAVIHTVGPFIRERKLFLEHSVSDILKLTEGNLLSSFWIAKEFLPMIRQSGNGRLIYFGFGRVEEAPAWPDRSVYAATKTALASFTKSLAVEEACHGVTVNLLCPGDIVGEKKEMSIKEVSQLTDNETPRGRPGSGEDVARVVQFLLEEKADFFTGNILDITGGLDVITPFSKRLTK